MSQKTSAIALPFGESLAICHEDEQSHGELIERVFPGLIGYEALETPTGFFSKTATLVFPSISIMAMAMSASQVKRDGRQHLLMMLPFAGWFEGTMAGKTLQWAAGSEGVLMPEYDGLLIGSGSDRGALGLRLDARVLEQTALAMRGPFGPRIELRLDEFRTFPLQLHGRPLDPILWQMGKLVEAMGCDVNVLALHGYEDVFNRLVVGLIHPELLTETASAKREAPSHRAKVINDLCDQMLANLGNKITLTELENKSGYSARALQYAFQERFGFSPLGWLREQRLLAARKQLLEGNQQSIAQLADTFGFGTASQFCTVYKRRFGETPGGTSNESR